MSALKEHYQTLGLASQFSSADEISQEEIRKAYRELARQLHPDKNRDDPEATVKFQKLTHAYEILSDPTKRSVYDGFGDEGVKQHSQAGEFGQFFSHPWLLSKWRWLAFVALWSLFVSLNWFTKWPIDWILIAGATTYFGPLAPFVYNFLASFIKDMMGEPRKNLARYSAAAVLLFASFLTYHLLATRVLVWMTDILTCSALLLLVNQSNRNYDLSLGLAVAAQLFNPKLRHSKFAISKWSNLLAAYVFLNALGSTLLLALFLTLPRPVKIARSYVAVPLFKVLGVIVLLVLRLQSEWNWLILLLWGAVLIFDHFLCSSWWLPRLEHIFIILQHFLFHTVKVGVFFGGRTKNYTRAKYLLYNGAAFLAPYLLRRFDLFSRETMLFLGSLFLHLSLARLAYMVTLNSGSRSFVKRWWSAVFTAAIALLMESYFRGFGAVIWHRTAAISMGAYFLLFIEMFRMSQEDFDLFAQGDENSSSSSARRERHEGEASSTSSQQQHRQRRKHRR